MKTNFDWKGFFIGFLFLLNFGHVAFGQVDSLKNVIKSLPNGKEKLDVYYQIAANTFMTEPTTAILYADTLERLSKKLNSKDGLSKAYYIKGVSNTRLSNSIQAIDFVKKSLEIVTQLNDKKRLAKIYNVLGLNYKELSLFEDAIDAFHSSMKYAKETEDLETNAMALNNIADVFFKISDMKSAEKHLLEAKDIFDQLGNYDNTSAILSALAVMTEDTIKEKLYLDKAFEAAKKGKGFALSNIYINYCSYYNQIKNYPLALEYAQKAYRISETTNNTLDKIISANNVGLVFHNLNVLDSAVYYFEEAISLAKKHNLNDKLGQIYLRTSYLYANELNNPKKGFEYLERAYHLNDTIKNNENLRQIQANSAKYEFEKNQRTIAEQNLEISQARNKRNTIIIIAILLLAAIAGFYQWNLYRQRQKAQADRLALAQQQAEADRLRELDQLKSNFFTNLSHELRTPLTLILSPIADAIETAKSNPQKNKLKIVQTNAQKLLNLVNEIMDLSKTEVGKLQINTANIALVPFVKRLFSAFESLAEIRKIDFQLHINDIDEKLIAKIDLEKFEKIINNLLANALKYTNANGSVTMNVFQKNNQFHFEIKDTGKGIHADDQPHIFNRFYQAKKGDAPLQGGTGVGLALSKELAKLLDGDITFESQLEKGSTFLFSIPLEIVENPSTTIKMEEAETASATPFVPTYQPIAINGEKPRLLIVEDNLEMSKYLVEILSNDYQCTTAADGQEALKQLKLYHFDCITSDVMMPNMDGFELREQINKNKDWKQIPFLLLTARYLESDKLKGFQLGIDDYITKPFSTKELQARIHNLISNKIERDNFVKTEQQPNEATGVRLSVDQDLLQTCEKVILDNLDNSNFKVEDLANQVNYSQKNLGRIIKKLTGLTPVKFILEVRLQKARELLEKGLVATVIEAQMEVGIGSTSYFTKKFTQRFGKNPKEIRG